MKDYIYFDHAATTPIHSEVLDVLADKLKSLPGNPSSSHSLGQRARMEIEQSRNKIATLLNVKSSELFFTSGATEAINMILRGAIAKNKINHVITSALEHHAVLSSIKNITPEISVDFVEHNSQGEINLVHLDKLLSSNPNSLVAIMGVNNEIGNINPIDDISDLCQKYNAKLFCDMVQAVGKTKINLPKVDFASFTAHKFYGSKGVGFAYISAKSQVTPLLFGGGQEQNMRAGTENTAFIIGLAKALEIVYRDFDKQLKHITELNHYFVEQLAKSSCKIEYIGSKTDKVPHIVNFSILNYPDIDSLHILLDMNKICVSAGSACASGSVQKSHVLSAIRDDIDHSMRVSFGRQNTKSEIDTFIHILNNQITLKK